MHYLSSVYFVNQPLHVSGVFIVVYVYTEYLLIMGYKYAQNM